MIKTFADKHTKKLFEGGNPRQVRVFQRQAEMKLQMLDMAATLDFLRSLRVTDLRLYPVTDRAGTA